MRSSGVQESRGAHAKPWLSTASWEEQELVVAAEQENSKEIYADPVLEIPAQPCSTC